MDIQLQKKKHDTSIRMSQLSEVSQSLITIKTQEYQKMQRNTDIQWSLQDTIQQPETLA